MVTVREFDLADFPAVALLWRQSGLPPKPGDNLEAVRHKLTRDPDLFLVAEEEGRVVGSVMGAYDGRRGTVYRVCVHAEHRRRRVAAGLMAEVESRLRAKGCTQVNLLVEEGNAAALEFYARCGYGPMPYIALTKSIVPGR